MDPLYVQMRPLAAEYAWLTHKVRIQDPAEALARLTPSKVMIVNGVMRLRAEPGTVLIDQRSHMTPQEAQEQIPVLLRHGYVTVFEIDDLPSGLAPYVAENYYTLGCYHAIQTSTPEIAEFIRAAGLHDEIAVFPNQIAALPPPPRPRPAAPVRLLYAALRRRDSWVEILPGLNRALARLGDHVALTVVQDRAFFDAVETPHKRFFPLLAYDDYLALLAEADIHLLPLADTAFNRAKSDLKFIESAAYGAVSLASPTVYARSLRPDETGVLFDGPDALERELLALAADPARRDRLRAAAYAYVRRERLIEQHVGARYDWLRSLVARRAALTAALKARRSELV